MIQVGGVILNEELIKVAMPYFKVPQEGHCLPFPPPSTKIIFTDNSELIFENMDVNCLFTELNNIKK
jgi:hypothetical protein